MKRLGQLEGSDGTEGPHLIRIRIGVRVRVRVWIRVRARARVRVRVKVRLRVKAHTPPRRRPVHRQTPRGARLRHLVRG